MLKPGHAADGEEQPEDAQRLAVAAWLERELARIDRVTPPDPGRVTARRLNRVEYNNTVRELLGVNLRPADDFPQDDAGYGFDNIADVLSLSPVLMEKYLSAADAVARTAVFGPASLKPTLTRCDRRGAARRGPRVPGAVRRQAVSACRTVPAAHRVPVEGGSLQGIPRGQRGGQFVAIDLHLDRRPSGAERQPRQEKYGGSSSIGRTSAVSPRSSRSG